MCRMWWEFRRRLPKSCKKQAFPQKKKIIAIATHEYEHEIELLSLLWMLFSFATSARYLDDDDDDEYVNFPCFPLTEFSSIWFFYHSAN